MAARANLAPGYTLLSPFRGRYATGTSAVEYGLRDAIALNSSQKLYFEYLTFLAILCAGSLLINLKALVISRFFTLKRAFSMILSAVEKKTLSGGSVLFILLPTTMSGESFPSSFQRTPKSEGSYWPSESMNRM